MKCINLQHVFRQSKLYVALMTAAMTSLTVMTSCIKDEEPNKECDIVEAWVDETYNSLFYDVKENKEIVSSTQQTIEFEVRSLLSLPNDIAVQFKLTPGATINPANGSKQDFTQGPVTYTVTSEDGQWTKQYKVTFIESNMPTSTLSFENARTITKGSNSYHEFYELDNDNTLNCWASGNEGAIMVKNNSKPEGQPTYQAEAGYKGKCVCMNTQSAGDLGALFGKPIAAGNLFMGKFIVDEVFTPLKTTRFGITYTREPIRIKGYYKYQPGKEFTNAKQKVLNDRVDEADIYAVFYYNKNEKGESYYLYGDDVSDEKLKANPLVFKTARVKSLPATNEWKPFEMFFEGKDINEEDLTKGNYSLALVFSSSKNGAAFEGAIGSTLYVDEVDIIFDK